MSTNEDHGARIDELPPLWRYELRRDASLAVWNRRRSEASLIARAARDDDFRQVLLADPRAAIAEELGVTLPEGVSYTVLEDTDEVLHCVLPARPHGGTSGPASGAPIGATLDEVARWAVEEQPTTLLDRDATVELVARAWRDESLLAALRSDARGTLEETFGAWFDGGSRIELFVETERALALVLPSLGVGAAAGPAWQEDEDELMMQILASPCFQSHPDPCPPGSRISM